MQALLVIDMQNDFVHAAGTLSFPGAAVLIPEIVHNISVYKQNNWPIITTQDWHSPDDLEFERFPTHCVAGTVGAELTPEIASALKNYAHHKPILKTRYSAFYNTGLDQILDDIQPKLVEVVGVCTNICVLHSVEELRNRDIPVRVLANAVDSFDQEGHRFSLKHMENILGAEVKQ